MKVRVWIGSVVAPLALACLYPVGLLLTDDQLRWYWSEWGPAELLTAVIFIATGVIALGVFRRTDKKAPTPWRVLYLLFALAAFIMAGEELSWGQHLLGIETPEKIREHGKEINLHNLFNDKPSRLARRVAEFGLPVFCIVMPLVLLCLEKRRQTYVPPHWSWYLMPRLEAALPLVLALACRPIGRLDDRGYPWQWSWGIGELAELFWSLAVLLWAMTISRRLATAPDASIASGQPAAATDAANGSDAVRGSSAP